MANNSEDAKAPISLPKGGGAIKGIGETFQPNLFSGTGNFSVPIFTSPGRNGFGPKLSLQYSTGNGNGPFGLGWQLSVPRITRKTEKGLPTYKNEDVFVMSGAEDLVPHLERVSGDPDRWAPVVRTQDDYTVSLYRPRTEGQFARIERWEHQNGDVHWQATTKENVTSIYGRTAPARIVDPHNTNRVFEWLLEETFDARGNHILYEYIHEDPALSLPGIHENNRSYTQAYIRRILYGNTPDILDAGLKAGPTRTATDHAAPLQTRKQHYVFEVLFDYGEFDNDDIPFPPGIPHETPLNPEDSIPDNWPVRDDPFSSFRAGFEIRTLRRCKRVLMLHHFKEGELDGAPLVKSTDFEYEANSDTLLSLLASVTVRGYRKDPSSPQRYLKRDMPPVTFHYTRFEPQAQKYQSVTAKGGDLPPRGLNAPDFALMDVSGNGMTDIVQSNDTGFYFWQNFGQGHIDRRRTQPGGQPAVSFAQGNVSFGDMAGDGLADLVVDAPPMSGFYESSPDGGWRTFKRFEAMPSFELDNPNTRLVDLTGDGLSDVLVTRDDHFLWFRCRGEAGYDDPRTVAREHDLNAFPDVYFADPAGRVRLADMSGDGLNDIVLIHDGRIDYWPNLGYGRFGRRITMANTPRIGFGFDPRRMFLVDIDGTGCVDLVYVESGKLDFWFNQSGNAWSGQQTIYGTPYVTDFTAVQFTDFYGTGTATLLWSYDFAEQPGGNYKVLDFCGGQKPHLLVGMSNNMGATTRVQYAPSTKFYLEDKANGRPWLTSLPFPVHVLEKTEVIDHISKTKLVTTYKYHHGYYDGNEREFRGFGRVDQFDTELFGDFAGSSLHGDGAGFDNTQKGFHVPPVETRTWFHTGVYYDPDRVVDHRDLTQQYRSEYYQGDPDAFVLEEELFEQADGSRGSGDTPHEAFRALRGAVLRTEVYGRDDSAKSGDPYAVTENRYLIKALQPKNGNNHGVYLTLPNENVSYHYERNPTDPRISHNITLGIDDFGNVTDSVAIGYPRRIVPADIPEQGQIQAVYTHTDFINKFSASSLTKPAFYYAGIPCQTRTYEVTGLDEQFDNNRLDEQIFQGILDTSIVVDTDSFLPYEAKRDDSAVGLQRRIIEWTRSYFRTDADSDQIDPVRSLTHRLPLGEIASLGLPYEGYQAAFTDSMLQQIYGDRIVGIDLAGEGGYHPHQSHAAAEGVEGDIQEYHWIPSGRQNFDPAKFFQTDHTQDPFGQVSSSDSDAYALLIETARDALPPPLTNVISAKNDYRVLQPFETTDPNGNRSQVAFDALGLVVGSAVMGEDAEGNPVGDSLEGFVSDLPDDLRNRHIDDPLNLDNTVNTDGHNILKGATSRLVYDLKRFDDSGQPNVVYAINRETHVSEENGTPSKIQHTFTYSDGLGRESQTKIQAEPDPDDPTKPRWVGTGTMIYNNKGKAVQQFEPFFSGDHLHGIERHGVSPTIFYDPIARVVCTAHPNHTYDKVVFDPWRQTSWDSNDTVRLDPREDPDIREYVEGFFLKYDQEYEEQHGKRPQTWHQENSSSDDTAQKDAARKTELHADTPTVVHLDTLGRTFLTVAHNKVKRTDNDPAAPPIEEFHRSRMVFDIEGNQSEVVDAKDRIVVHYDYNMLSALTHQASMEAGDRWMLIDVAGQPIRAWDSRGHIFRTEYDPLRRPLRSFVTGADPANPNQEILTERLVYGEQHPQAEQMNLRGVLHLHLDQAGRTATETLDYKGNPLHTSRRVATQFKQAIDWHTVDAALPPDAATPLNPDELETELALQLEDKPYTSLSTFDALNRPIQIIPPHSSQAGAKRNVIQPVYNEAGLLERMDIWLDHPNRPDSLLDVDDVPPSPVGVNNIDYDAKGQRFRIGYKNGVTTRYDYDPDTFRLIHLYTRRGVSFTEDCGNDPPPPRFAAPDNPPPGTPCGLQNLYYTYDPAGNITHIRDEAQQTIFFRNKRVEPSNDFTYDAIYRLIEAKGREHLGQVGGSPIPHSYNDARRTGIDSAANDGNAMGTYTEHYVYDAVGNILEMQHRGREPGHNGWTRAYSYNIASLIEPDKQSNRLSRTIINPNGVQPIGENYTYDAHGNMLTMPQLQIMEWGFLDQLQVTQRQKVNEEDEDGIKRHGERTFYVYDAAGQRVRKVTEMANGHLKDERIYLRGIEIYRRHAGPHPGLVREKLHIMDDEQRIALVETRNETDDGTAKQLIRYQIGNHLGSASLELDHQAQIISYEEYFPYGSTSYQAVRSQIETPKQYRYTAQERDEESGFCYHGARYYAVWLGRWISADPLGIEDGLNLYQYVQSNPAKRVDNSGTKSEEQLAEDAFEAYLIDQKVEYKRQVNIKVKVDGEWIDGRVDFLVSRPGSEWEPVEFKGKGMSSLTDNQKKYLPALREGADFEVTGRFQKGYKGSGGGKVITLKSVKDAKRQFRRIISAEYINRTQGFKDQIDTDLEGNVESRKRTALSKHKRGQRGSASVGMLGSIVAIGGLAGLVIAGREKEAGIEAGKMGGGAVSAYGASRTGARFGSKAPGLWKVPGALVGAFAGGCLFGGECNPIDALKGAGEAAVALAEEAYERPVWTGLNLATLGLPEALVNLSEAGAKAKAEEIMERYEKNPDGWWWYDPFDPF